MLSADFKGIKNVLCLGAHADDIEIGCGGTILKLAREHPQLNVLWVVFSAEGTRAREARAGARAFLRGAGTKQVALARFTMSFFPFQGERIKQFFERIKRRFEPDLVFTHFRDDRHQDHRILSDLAWNTYRNHVILEYEIPKYDGDLGNPNFFVPLDEELCRLKSQYICSSFQTQTHKHWFSADTFLSLMRLRGIECASKYAEAFYSRKLVLG